MADSIGNNLGFNNIDFSTRIQNQVNTDIDGLDISQETKVPNQEDSFSTHEASNNTTNPKAEWSNSGAKEEPTLVARDFAREASITNQFEDGRVMGVRDVIVIFTGTNTGNPADLQLVGVQDPANPRTLNPGEKEKRILVGEVLELGESMEADGGIIDLNRDGFDIGVGTGGDIAIKIPTSVPTVVDENGNYERFPGMDAAFGLFGRAVRNDPNYYGEMSVPDFDQKMSGNQDFIVFDESELRENNRLVEIPIRGIRKTGEW